MIKTNLFINGYLHDIWENKFCLLFCSEIQVLSFMVVSYTQLLICNHIIISKNLTYDIYQEYPIWYFDATGGILKKIKEQSKALLNSTVTTKKED